MQVGDVRDRDDRSLRCNGVLVCVAHQVVPGDVRLAFELHDLSICGACAVADHRTRAQPARLHASTGAFSTSLAISTGSGRIASRTWVPAGYAAAWAVGSWARTVISPRSTETRLVAPRNATVITVPVSGPGTDPSSAPSDTASGRTRATAGPFAAFGWTRGSRTPRTSTSPSRTVPSSRLVRPTNSATKGVAGRE